MKSLLTAIICMSFVTTAYCQTDSLVTSDTVAAAQQDTSDAAFQLWIKEIFDGIFAHPQLDSLKQVSADSIRILSKSIKVMKKKESKATAAHYPWKDVLDCMTEGKVYYSNDIGDCGERLVAVIFSSPQWTWKKLCGRTGLLYICPVCKRQVKFECWGMN